MTHNAFCFDAPPVGQNYTRNFPKGGRIAGKINRSVLSPVAVDVERGAATECCLYTSRDFTCSTICRPRCVEEAPASFWMRSSPGDQDRTAGAIGDLQSLPFDIIHPVLFAGHATRTASGPAETPLRKQGL